MVKFQILKVFILYGLLFSKFFWVVFLQEICHTLCKFFLFKLKVLLFFIQIKSAPKINCLMTTQILTLFQSAQL